MLHSDFDVRYHITLLDDGTEQCAHLNLHAGETLTECICAYDAHCYCVGRRQDIDLNHSSTMAGALCARDNFDGDRCASSSRAGVMSGAETIAKLKH